VAIGTVASPDQSTAIFPTRLATFVANSIFCLLAETAETSKTFATGDLAETSHYCRRLAPLLPPPPMDPPLPTRQRI